MNEGRVTIQSPRYIGPSTRAHTSQVPSGHRLAIAAVLTCCAVAGIALNLAVLVIWPSPTGMIAGSVAATFTVAFGGFFATGSFLRTILAEQEQTP